MPLAIADDYRLQDEAPIRGAVDVDRHEESPLDIAELVELEQRVVAVTAEVSVPRRALLSSVGWALGTIHVENDAVGTFAGVDPVDPSAGESREAREVDVARQPLGLVAPIWADATYRRRSDLADPSLVWFSAIR
jgi:hypothetical protein